MGQTLAKRIRDKRESEKKVVHDRRAVDLVHTDVYAVEIDDPYEPGAKITAFRSKRSDPLARLHAHHQIDEAQYLAGRAYQRDWETAERGAQAIDPSKEFVDGGRLAEPITEPQRRARIRLVRIQRELGRHMYKVAHGVLIGGVTIESLTIGFGRSGQTWTKYYGAMFRDGLDLLAVEYRLASR